MSLVLEGGAALQASAWNEGLVDAVHLYVAPVTFGDAGVPWLDPDVISTARLADLRKLELGPDVFLEGYVHGID
jgi:riboflavin biosynthesis pyrimidine reductase